MIGSDLGLRARVLRIAASGVLDALTLVKDSEMPPQDRQRITNAMNTIAACADRLESTVTRFDDLIHLSVR